MNLTRVFIGTNGFCLIYGIIVAMMVYAQSESSSSKEKFIKIIYLLTIIVLLNNLIILLNLFPIEENTSPLQTTIIIIIPLALSGLILYIAGFRGPVMLIKNTEADGVEPRIKSLKFLWRFSDYYYLKYNKFSGPLSGNTQFPAALFSIQFSKATIEKLYQVKFNFFLSYQKRTYISYLDVWKKEMTETMNEVWERRKSTVLDINAPLEEKVESMLKEFIKKFEQKYSIRLSIETLFFQRDVPKIIDRVTIENKNNKLYTRAEPTKVALGS